MDVSGLCTKEALVCGTPMMMPYGKYFIDKINQFSSNPVNPVFKSLIRSKAIVNCVDDIDYSGQKNMIKNIKKDWYNTNIDLFWKKVLS